MITFDNKQVLVTGVEAQYAQVHYAQAMGVSATVEISDLRATTIQELEDVLLNAPRVSLAGSEVQYPRDDLDEEVAEREREEWEALSEAY